MKLVQLLDPPSNTKGLVQTSLIYAFLHLALDGASTMFSLANLGITPWNPPAGLALTAFLLWGGRAFPGVVAGCLISEYIVRSGALGPVASLLLACLVAGSYWGLSVFSLKALKMGRELLALRDLAMLVAAGLMATSIVACAYVGFLVLLGKISADVVGLALVRYWVGDAIGVLVVTSLLLVLAREAKRGLPRPGPEQGVQFLAIVLVLLVVFGLEAANEFKFFYLLFLPAIWITVRHGLLGAALTIFITEAGMMELTAIFHYEAATVTSLQVLMVVLAVSVLLLGCVVDERQNAQAALREHQMQLAQIGRLSLAGELASGLAHELNQPLAAIVNYVKAAAGLIRAQPPRSAEGLEALDKAGQQAMRASRIIENMREFLRRGESGLKPVSLLRTLETAVELASIEAKRQSVRLYLDVPSKLPWVAADPVQIEQVMLNLLLNAIEAIGEAGAPRRQVTVSARQLPEGQIEAAVADTGPGIDAAMRARLWEPFATSKSDGMGLGLSICRSIVEAHGGLMWVEETPGGGATFRFTLLTGKDDHD
jgi:two-component system sensor kinase FixL